MFFVFFKWRPKVPPKHRFPCSVQNSYQSKVANTIYPLPSTHTTTFAMSNILEYTSMYWLLNQNSNYVCVRVVVTNNTKSLTKWDWMFSPKRWWTGASTNNAAKRRMLDQCLRHIWKLRHHFHAIIVMKKSIIIVLNIKLTYIKNGAYLHDILNHRCTGH